MGDSLQACKPSRYVTSHPGQLSLAIPPWVGAMSTSESWVVNRHTAQCTSRVSVVWQCKLASGWGLRKRRSAPLYVPYGSGRTYVFLRVEYGLFTARTFLYSSRSCWNFSDMICIYMHNIQIHISFPNASVWSTFRILCICIDWVLCGLVRIREKDRGQSYALSMSFHRMTKHYKIDKRKTVDGEVLAIEEGPTFENLMDVSSNYGRVLYYCPVSFTWLDTF